MKELEAYKKITDLIEYSNKFIISSFPKEYTALKIKFSDNLYLLLEMIIRANVNVGSIRSKFQKEILVGLYLLDYYIEEIKKLNVITSKRYLSFVNKLSMIHRLINGWIKSEKSG